MSARLVAVLAAVALLVAGCGGSGSRSTDHPVAKPESGATTQAPGLPKGVKQVAKVPTQVPNTPDLRRNVAITGCEASASGWRAAGTATNTGKGARDYTITVFFTTRYATVIGTGRTTVSVKPGDSEHWSISDDFKAPKGTRCVLRGVG